jgi:arylsulfate sulfotransferase
MLKRMSFWRGGPVVLMALVEFTSGNLKAGITVEFATSVKSPQPVGTSITLEAKATDSGPGPVTYQFQVQAPGSTTFSMIQDFSLLPIFNWVPTTTDGTYVLQLIARDFTAGTVSEPAKISFTLTSRVNGTVPVVTATTNPLVALFSAPSCPAGSTMRVQFRESGAEATYYTDFRPCLTTSMNFLIGGMRQSGTYKMQYDIDTAGVITVNSTIVEFTTGAIPSNVDLPAVSLPVPLSSSGSQNEKVMLAGIAKGSVPFATDLQGNYIWYYNNPDVNQVTRPVEGGTILVLLNGSGTGTGYWGPDVTKQQQVAEIDLAGHVVRTTSADRVSEQIPKSDLPYGLDRFSHEARKLPNGNYLVLGESQQIFPAGTQGSATPIDLIGPVFVVLDPNFQVIWYWNVFDHLGSSPGIDPNRSSVLTSPCLYESNGQTSNGCPPVLLLSPAEDWQHANALQYLPDGNILLSARDQDWIYKIDYNNGTGTGKILWTMGRKGDFTFTGTDLTWPWFSGQHDPEFQNNQMLEMSVYDDGNTRIAYQGGGDSFGQVLSVDESTMTVSYILNADMGVYSYALGSSQLLQNGDWFFDNGEIEPQRDYTQVIEVNGTGVQEFNEQIQYTTYRAWRMTDFYNVSAIE